MNDGATLRMLHELSVVFREATCIWLHELRSVRYMNYAGTLRTLHEYCGDAFKTVRTLCWLFRTPHELSVTPGLCVYDHEAQGLHA